MSPRSSRPERAVIRASATRAAALLSLALLGCPPADPGVGPTFPTASELPDEDRRAAGVAVDRRSDPPAAVDRADGDENIVTLRAPLGDGPAFAAVETFFTAMLREDMGELMEVVGASAMLQELTSSQRTHGAAALWRQRFRKRDYNLLAGHLIYRPSDIRTYRGEHLHDVPVDVHGTDQEPVRPTDLVLMVPIATHTLDNERYLGDEIYFWLRREGDGYLIYRLAEDVPF